MIEALRSRRDFDGIVGGQRAMVSKRKSVYNALMNSLPLAPPAASSGEDQDGLLEVDIQRLEAMVPQMAVAAKAAQADAYARLATLHARIAQEIVALRKSEACAPSSR